MEDVQTLFSRSPALAEWLNNAVLVPVPLHPSRRRKRDYNQSELLAQAISRAVSSKSQVRAASNIKIASLLRRIQNTRSQTRYDKRARLENLKNAFALAKCARVDPEQRYVLVDDVFTTGATLNSCARVLRRAGCQHIDVLAFGHG
ncbi:ComF family protein [Cephaloticoccus primus]|uniref:ComF family protein n=1 Tax=Cephaloticoccus primus TaxID=1548207 RepID=UPI001E653BDC|nr:hypothetical protein [Cephaloticoccus primus]